MKPETVQLARDLMRHTLHGPPPIATTMALAEAVIAGAADLAALRVEHETVKGLLTATRRDRDEARATIRGYEKECAEIDQTLGRVLGYPPNPDGAPGVCTGEHAPASLAVEAAWRIAELEATILNERGEGAPPSKGWAFIDCTWRKDDWKIHRYDSGERVRWIPLLGGWPQPVAVTAREAMKAADTALAGSKS